MDNRYRYNRAYRSFLLAVLAVVAVVVTAVAAVQHLQRFFGHNLWVNGLILAVFTAGLLLVFLNLLRLTREEHLANVVVKRTFTEGREGWDAAHLLDRLHQSAVKTRVAQVAEIGARGGVASQEILAEIGASEESARAAAVRYLVGILVFLGLLGTFLGLLITVEGVRQVLAGLEYDPYADMQVFLRELRTNLAVPLTGMGTAFSTSLFGLGTSVILGFLGLQMTRAQEYFLAKLNDLTLIYLVPAYVTAPEAAALPRAAAPAAAAPGAPARGDFRTLETGARYLEAGARALHKDVEGLTEVASRTDASHRELRESVAQLAEAVRKGTELLARMEADQRGGREESLRLLEEQVRHARGTGEMRDSLRAMEERMGEMLAALQRLGPAAEERDRMLQAVLEREARTVAGQLGANLSDLAELGDAAAREVCRRLSEGLGSLESAVGGLQSALAKPPPKPAAPSSPSRSGGPGPGGGGESPSGVES